MQTERLIFLKIVKLFRYVSILKPVTYRANTSIAEQLFWTITMLKTKWMNVQLVNTLPCILFKNKLPWQLCYYCNFIKRKWIVSASNNATNKTSIIHYPNLCTSYCHFIVYANIIWVASIWKYGKGHIKHNTD